VTKRHYHLIGIGGTAMASVAGLLREAGHEVTGSDENVYPPMSDQLRELGIPYAEGYSPLNVGLGGGRTARPDLVVVGNAISRGNPELEAVLDEGLPYTSAAAVVKEEFLRGRHSIAIAGTHGKTTTGSLAAWLLEAAGLDPCFLVGGIAENFGTSFRLTGSPYFVIEADEYDTAYFDKGPKMWHYLPQTAVVNNIEFDHADIYRDEEAYRLAFARFINLVPRNGRLIAGWDSPIVRELAPHAFCPVESFAFSPAPEGAEAFWRAEDVEFGETTTRFVVRRGEELWGSVETPLAGAFNVRNCLAAIAVGEAVGADRDGLREGLRTFRSVRRRMELRGEVAGITVIDDFAHHPTAVNETIQATRQRFTGRRLVAVFEPRSYTAQRREFQGPYQRAFTGADEVILAGLFHPERYSETTGMNPTELVGALREEGTPANYIPDVDEIVRHLTATLGGGEIVLIMSNGGFGGIHDKLMAALRERTVR
jgi:UDP-N-acetylmuramate: L-alanyl-gamma-D-glutamyl-meso-diaminopimelate ligase